VRKAQESRPDLIVLDLSMPVMNGLDAARILRRVLPAVPLILFTMYSKDLGKEARSAGISVIVSKAEATTLIDKARSLLH